MNQIILNNFENEIRSEGLTYKKDILSERNIKLNNIRTEGNSLENKNRTSKIANIDMKDFVENSIYNMNCSENEDTIINNFYDDLDDNDNERNMKLKSLKDIIQEYPDNTRLKEIIYKNSINKIINLFIAYHKLCQSKIKDNGADSILKNKNSQKINNDYIYIGDNSNNSTKEGFGIQKWADGSKCVGHFKNDKSNGLGKFIDNENNYLFGNFVDDKLEGFGIYSYKNGSKYIGEWLNDLQDGIGLEYWKDGSMYNGQFSNGKKNGLGVYIWGDGSKYEGEWKDNNLSGYGIYYFSNKDKIYTGEWKNNMMNGIGELVWIKQGRKYLGYFIDDKINGLGLLIWRNPLKIFIGFWSNGKQNGIGKYMDSHKEKYGIWKNGKIVKWIKNDEKIEEYIEKDFNLINIFFEKTLKELEEKFSTIENP